MSKQPPDSPIGYKKPPSHSRFRPGQSGNPGGRPRGSKTLKQDLREALDEFVVRREGGREIEMTKRRAVAERLVAMAMGGDVRAIAALFAECARGAPADENNEKPPSPAEAEIIKDFAKEERWRTKSSETTDTPPAGSTSKDDGTHEP